MKNLLSRFLLASLLLTPQLNVASPGPGEQKAEGIWVTHANLPPQAGAGSGETGLSYAGTATFKANGTVVGTPLDQHTGGSFGMWERIGRREFAFTFVADSYDPAGNYVNTNRVRGKMLVSEDGLSGQGRTLLEILDKTGTVVFTAPATTTFTAVRVTVLPLD